MEHKQNPTTGKLRKAINYQQMKIQQQISWVGQSTRYFLKGGEKFQPLGSKTLLTRQKGETVCTKEGESSCAATYALSCEFRSNTFEPFEQEIFCGATFYEGHLLIQMFNRLFIGPRSDHSLPMSVTDWLTNSLTHWRPCWRLNELTFGDGIKYLSDVDIEMKSRFSCQQLKTSGKASLQSWQQL